MRLDIYMYLFNKCQKVHKYELKTNLFDTCKVGEHEKKTILFYDYYYIHQWIYTIYVQIFRTHFLYIV
jgi:hypothetical protein